MKSIKKFLSIGFRVFLDTSNFIERNLLVLCVAIMAVNNVGNVVGRTLFNKSLYFSEELNVILIIMITFTGMSFAARHAMHIRMTAIYDSLPDSAKRYLLISIGLSTSILMFAMAYFSYEYIMDLYQKGRTLPALQIKVFWIYIWMPISFFMTGLQYLRTAYRNIKDKQLHLSTRVTSDAFQQLEI